MEKMTQQTDLPKGATPLDPEEMAWLKLKHIRNRYIDALVSADQNNYEPLKNFFRA